MTRKELGAMALLSVGLVGCRGHEPSKTSEKAVAPSREVTVALVTRSGVVGEVTVPGVVHARQTASLAARFPASVVLLPFQEGQVVPAGAVVVRLDDSAQKAALAAAEASLVAIEADLNRTRTLVERNAATPRELEEQTARLAGAQAQVAAAKDSLAYAVLRAPFGGVLSARRANVGDVVNPGVPLVLIEGREGFEVRATVESSLATSLRPGSLVRAEVDGQASPLPATVRALAPSGDATTHRFELKADLPAARGLRAGLFARLVFAGVVAEERLTVPARAVFERGGLTGLFVVRDGKARLRWVAAGASSGDFVEIRAGVDAGEQVVTEPAGLVDGAAVRETGR